MPEDQKLAEEEALHARPAGDDLGEQAADPNEHPTGAPCSDPWCADKESGDRD